MVIECHIVQCIPGETSFRVCTGGSSWYTKPGAGPGGGGGF